MAEIYESESANPKEILAKEYTVQDLESVYKVAPYPLCNYCSISGGELIVNDT